MRIFENLNYDFLSKRKFFYAFSAGLFLIGVLSIIFRGLEFGIDFKGGTEIVLQFEKTVEVGEIRGYVEELGLGNIEVKTFGGETGVLIRTEEQQIPAEIYPAVVQNIENEIDRILPGVERRIIDSTATTVTYSFPNPDTTNILTSRLFQSGFQ